MTDPDQVGNEIARVGIAGDDLAALPDLERVELTPYEFARPWMAAFVSVLARGGDVSYAARVAQINRGHVYDVRKADPVFDAAWREAENVGTDFLRQVALRRATIGEMKRVTRTVTTTVDGKVEQVTETVTEALEYDNGLLRFLLGARDPQTYRERVDHRIVGPNDGPVQIEVYRQPDLTDPASRERLRALAELAAEPDEFPVIDGTAVNGDDVKPPPKRRTTAAKKKPATPAKRTTAARRRAARKPKDDQPGE